MRACVDSPASVTGMSCWLAAIRASVGDGRGGASCVGSAMGLWKTSSDKSLVVSVTATLDASSPTLSSSSERGGLGGGPCIIGERCLSGVGTIMRGGLASLDAESARRNTLETFFMIRRGAGEFGRRLLSAGIVGAGAACGGETTMLFFGFATAPASSLRFTMAVSAFPFWFASIFW